MKKTSNVLWGTVLVALGVVFALNAFDVTDIDVFFDGWWTLFIIVPCVIGIITERDKIGNATGVAIGVFLFLCCRKLRTRQSLLPGKCSPSMSLWDR